MNDTELQAAQADALRTWAKENDSPLLGEFADAIELNLSRDLEERYRASHELTREQKNTIDQLACTYDSVAFDDKFLPDGSAVVEGWNYSEDGWPVLAAVHTIEPGGISF